MEKYIGCLVQQRLDSGCQHFIEFSRKDSCPLAGTLKPVGILETIDSLGSPCQGKKPGEAEVQCHPSGWERNIHASFLRADLLRCGLGSRGRIVTQLQEGPQNNHGKLWSWEGPSEMSRMETGSGLLYSQNDQFGMQLTPGIGIDLGKEAPFVESKGC